MIFLSVLTSLLASSALAMECDNFTDRDQPIADSLEPLDDYTNLLIDKVLVAVNADSNGCDRERLYDKMSSRLTSTPWGIIEKFANKSTKVEKTRPGEVGTTVANSIYAGIGFFHYPLTKFSGIDPSIRVAGQLIGTDKLGHFMAEGHKTYTKIVEKDGSLEKAMRWGISTEEGYFGLGVSGVKSYGDLSANYAGARFWGSLVDGRDPYFTCRDGKFVKIRRFTWKDYVSAAWDEGVNCSQFSVYVGKIVLKSLGRMNQTCPVKGMEQVCADLANLDDAKWYVSPMCLNFSKFSARGTLDQRILIVKGRSGD